VSDDRLALVLAGGGERAVAWELGVLAGLAAAGLDLAAAQQVIGTSAGALVGAHVAAGADPLATARAICAWPTAGADGAPALGKRPATPGTAVPDTASREAAPPGDPSPDAAASQPDAARALNDDEPPGPAFAQALGTWIAAADAGAEEQRRQVGAVALTGPQGDERLVAATKRRVPASGWAATLALVAIDADSGERVALWQVDGVPLERAVAASRAIPGLRPVVAAAGRRLMDGAVGSATNADLAGGARRIAIVTPTPAEAPPDSLFALWNAALERERALLEGDGAELLVVQAGAVDQEAMGPDMLSGARAREAFEAGRRRGVEALVSCRRPDRWRSPASA
jgi:NTE family protein